MNREMLHGSSDAFLVHFFFRPRRRPKSDTSSNEHIGPTSLNIFIGMQCTRDGVHCACAIGIVLLMIMTSYLFG